MGRGTRARERGPAKLRWPGGATALVALGCVDRPEIEMPVPPDLAPLVEAYAQPDGTVAPQDVACLARSALDRVEDQRLRQVGEVLLDALQALQQRLQASGMPTETGPVDEDEPRLRGVLHLQRICRGWDPAATIPDPRQNGEIDLSALVEGTLRPVVWGQASACRARVELAGVGVNLFLDASLQLYLYRGLAAGGESAFLFRVQGQVGTEQERWPVDWDFRVSTSSIDLRLTGATGDVIAAIGGDRVELRTRDGIYVSDPATAGVCPE